MKFIVTGLIAALAGGALVGASFMVDAPATTFAGGISPTATPDPTIDPCDEFKPPVPATCVPTQPPRSESTNTPEPSDTPVATNTTAPEPSNTTAPPSTATPSGGAGAGGVSPPDTGSGPGEGGGVSWMLVAGGLLAAAGAGSLAYGVRRAR